MGWLNSDDIMMPDALARVGKVSANRPDVYIVYGNRIYVDSNEFDVGRCVLPPHGSETIKWSDFIPRETLFWRRNVWEATGGLRRVFHYALDWDFIPRASAQGFRFLHIAEFLACFRVHAAQKTTSLMAIGEKEMQHLRNKHLGFAPNPRRIAEAIASYTRRHIVAVAFYRLTGRTINLQTFFTRRPTATLGLP